VERKRRPLALAVLLLGLLVVVVGAVFIGVLASSWLSSGSGDNPQRATLATDTPKPSTRTSTEKEFPPPIKETGKKEPPVYPPNLLTVSKNPEDHAKYSTIGAALDQVEPGKIIRILDSADYEEALEIGRPERYAGVTLESAGNATLRSVPGEPAIITIRDVPDFTVRGLRFVIGTKCSAVALTGRCSGVVLDRLEVKADSKERTRGIQFNDVPLAGAQVPVVIQNCTLQGAEMGVQFWGHPSGKGGVTLAKNCGHVVIRNNTISGCLVGVSFQGAVLRVHVVGNRLVQSGHGAVGMVDLLPPASDLLIANNTILGGRMALGIWDAANACLERKNMRFHNNLILAPKLGADLAFFDHPPGVNEHTDKAGDIAALLKSPNWHLSHNWRELVKPHGPDAPFWIGACANDKLLPKIDVLSRQPGDVKNFLRPPNGSPLATAGVGDGVLPAYVGAVPPEEVPLWDWDKTWKALVH
jgi:hypothetical protein